MSLPRPVRQGHRLEGHGESGLNRPFDTKNPNLRAFCRFRHRLRRRPSPPLPSVADKLRRVGAPSAPGANVALLPCGRLAAGKRIRPAQIVPIVHMPRQGKHGLPQAAILGQQLHPTIGRRATAATLAREQFETLVRGDGRSTFHLKRRPRPRLPNVSIRHCCTPYGGQSNRSKRRSEASIHVPTESIWDGKPYAKNTSTLEM